MLNQIKNEFKNAKNNQQLLEIKNKLIKEMSAPLLQELKTANKDNRKDIGIKLKHIHENIENIYNDFLNNFANLNSSKEYVFTNNDMALNLIDANIGSKHILNIIIDDICNFFATLDFEIILGNEIVDIDNNFESLNISKHHPARINNDSLYFDENILLRTHCTANTASIIKNNKCDEIKVLSIGNVYRNDDDDATHSHQFMQLDLVWIKNKISLANLKWLVDNFLKFFFSSDIKTRYRLSYFPFTEPSFEVDISCFKCNNSGCNFCKNSGWIEIMGAGMLHPNVLEKANIQKKSAIAAGIGLERLAMLKYEFNDIRELYSNQYSILKQFKN